MTKELMALALALGLGSMAQAQDFDPARQLDHFSRADFLATLDQIGAKHEIEEGAPNIIIEFDNGLKADGLLMACEDQDTSEKCLGTSLLSTFSAPEGGSEAEIAAAITEYNFRENFGRAYVDPNGEISLRTYIIADGKITMENYRRQITLFVNSATDFFDYLYD